MPAWALDARNESSGIGAAGEFAPVSDIHKHKRFNLP
jgi:hypothetical protein